MCIRDRIDDLDVPLAVLEDDELTDVSSEVVEDEELTIEDENVPLASEVPRTGVAASINWAWLPVIGAIISGADGYLDKKEKKSPKNRKKDK